MIEAMIPYVVAPEWHITAPVVGQLTIGVFGVLVATGVLLGMQMCLRFAKAKDLDEWLVRDEMFWILVFGFIISHWISVLFYFPHRVYENPWVLVMLWNGLSSVGGFLGAFVGLHWFLRRNNQPALVFADMNMYGLLIGFIFGRAGCSLVHDHPGKQVDAGTFMAVGPFPCRCPEGRALPSCCTEAQEIFRYDLGLTEFLLLIPLAIFIYFFFDWKNAKAGLMTGIIAMYYAPMRFVLDFMRAYDVSSPDLRYFGLTTAQWVTLAIFGSGLWLVLRKPHPLDDSYAKDSDRIAQEKAAEEKAAAERDDESDDEDDEDEDDEDDAPRGDESDDDEDDADADDDDGDEDDEDEDE